jgi:Uma2 family endonuclease
MTTREDYLNAPELPSLLPKDLPSNDGDPLETPWHRFQMNLLIDVVQHHWRDRRDYFVGGNMFLYFSDRQVFNKDFRGPDFFLVKDCDRKPDRPYWATWQEHGRFPNVIIELLSPSTAEIDRTVKKELYNSTFHTREYYLFDPGIESFEAFHKHNGQYETIRPEENEMVWSKELEAYLGKWVGGYSCLQNRCWLRLFDVHGNLIPTPTEHEIQRAVEAEREVTRVQEEITRLRLEIDRLKNDSSPPN